jgi:predicted dehydrogenase
MIKIGVISLEHPHAAGNHFPALKYLADRVQVSAICHSDKKSADPWLKQFSADYYETRDELLARADLDAVLITSRNIDHARDCIASAEAKKDIFCDKPIATKPADAHNIIEAVRKNRVRFVTTYPVRFNTSVLKIKRAVEQGQLGTIKAIMASNHGCMYEPGTPDWVKDPHQNGGGCIIDHTVHVADIIRWLTRDEFKWVKAEARTALRDIAAEDMGVLHGELERGAIFQIDTSWSRRSRDPMWGDVTFRIIGTAGSASLDLYNNQRVELYDENGVSFRYPNYLAREHGEIFLDYLNNKKSNTLAIAADEMDGLRSLELVFAAYESIKTGNRVLVDRWNPMTGDMP